MEKNPINNISIDNIQQMLKMAEGLSQNNKKFTKSPHKVYTPDDPIDSVSSNDNSGVNPNTVLNKSDNDSAGDVADLCSHLTSIYGYSVPIKTLYFTLFIAAFVVLLYFMTSDKKKNEDDEKNKEQNKK